MRVKVTTENVKLYPQEFGRKLAESLGWNVKKVSEEWTFDVQNSDYVWGLCADLVSTKQMASIHEAEKEVIKRVNSFAYVAALLQVLFDVRLNAPFKQLRVGQIYQIATASPVQRLCAMLLSLGIEELEVSE